MIMRRSVSVLLAFVLVPVALAAQNAAPAKPAEPRPPSTTNVQIQVTIADYMGTVAPVKKAVSMIVADGTFGRIRSTYSNVSPTLNVDATPNLENGRVELRLALEYRPPANKDVNEPSMPINQSLTVLLESGKPLLITQAADPSKDRRVTVEVTATILK